MKDFECHDPAKLPLASEYFNKRPTCLLAIPPYIKSGATQLAGHWLDIRACGIKHWIVRIKYQTTITTDNKLLNPVEEDMWLQDLMYCFTVFSQNLRALTTLY